MFVRRIAPAGLLVAALALSGCGAEQAEDASPVAAASSSTPAAAAPAAPALSVTDPWVKAAKKGMTGAFGTLVNNTDAEVTVVSGATALASRVELHEVVDSDGKMIMRQKEGGFVIPAHGTHPLQPGGDHIMLIGVTEEVKPGAQIAFTLTLKDGTKLEFTAVGKDFAGGKENYQPGTHGSGEGMGMGEDMGKG